MISTVSVAPTETVVVQVAALDGVKRLHLQVTNLDGTQTFSGTVWTRNYEETALSQSTLPDFSSVAAGESRAAVIDVEGVPYVELRGAMSGAGGNVRASYWVKP